MNKIGKSFPVVADQRSSDT